MGQNSTIRPHSNDGEAYSVNIVLPNDIVLPVRFTTVDAIKTKVKEKTNIAKEKQIFYREGECQKLSSDEIPMFLKTKPLVCRRC